jgi:hypothetical protein
LAGRGPLGRRDEVKPGIFKDNAAKLVVLAK